LLQAVGKKKGNLGFSEKRNGLARTLKEKRPPDWHPTQEKQKGSIPWRRNQCPVKERPKPITFTKKRKKGGGRNFYLLPRG